MSLKQRIIHCCKKYGLDPMVYSFGDEKTVFSVSVASESNTVDRFTKFITDGIRDTPNIYQDLEDTVRSMSVMKQAFEMGVGQ